MTYICILCSIQSIVLEGLILIEEKRWGKNTLNKPVDFFASFFRGLAALFIFLAAIRVVTGKASLTLAECFSEASVDTWKHYVIITSIFVVLCAIVYRIILLSEIRSVFVNEWRKNFGGVFFLCFGLCYLFSFKFYNIFILIIGIFLVLFGLAWTIIKRRSNSNISKDDNATSFLKNIVYLAPGIVFCFFLDWILIPSEVYFGNINEMKIDVTNWLRGTVLPFFLFSIVYLIVWSLLLNKSVQLKIGYYVLIWIGLSEYIQYMFLNGKMHFLDGTVQSWGMNEIVINLLIWGITGCVLTIIAVIESKKIRKSHIVVWLLMVMFLVTTITLFATKANSTEKKSGFGSEGMLELSSQKNVIYFVLDAFDGAYMSYLLEQDDSLKTRFKDFTYYDNATSRYGFTGTGLPYLLTGVESDEMMAETDFINYAYSQGVFLPSISKAGVDVRVYSDADYFPDSVYGIIDNYGEEIQQTIDFVESVNLIRNISKYSSMPFVVKPYYKWGSWNVQNLISQYGYDPWNDRAIYHEICDYGLEVNETYSNGAFRFYHLQGAHLPYVMNENCESDSRATRYQRCAGVLKIVEKYISELKKIGAYNNSLIVITADHGCGGVDNVGELQDISHPILMVKLPGEEFDSLKISEEAVAQEDLFKPVIKYIDEENHLFDEFPSLCDEFSKDRIRQYTVMYTDYGKTDYLITGDVHERLNWVLEDYQPPID